MKTLFLILIYISFCLSVSAETFEDVKQIQEQRLQASMQSLSEERKALRLKILPLSESIRSLKKEERQWEERLQKLQGVGDSKTLSLDELKRQVEDVSKEMMHLESILVRDFLIEEASSVASYDSRREQLRQLDLDIESGVIPKGKSLPAQLQVIASFTDSLTHLLKVKHSSSKVLAEDGTWIEGEVIDIGPEQFFHSKENKRAGRLVDTLEGKPELKTEHQREVEAWLNGQASTLPLDVSGGKALKVAEVETTLEEQLKKGGIIVYPIIAFALLSALVALFKLIQLYGVSVSNPLLGVTLAKLMLEEKESEALALIKKQGKACRSMWNAAIKGKTNASLCDEYMMGSILEAQPKFERFIGFIAVTAAIAPLLGLLGTVTGIIKTFQMLEAFGAGDTMPLIGGISEALITTKLGLILAIPALMLHALLSRRSHSILAKMERASMAYVNTLASGQRDEKGAA